MTILHSARLRFEPMDDVHYDGLRVLNADPDVMRYITGQPETAEETRASIARVKARWEKFGIGWWCLIETASNELVGAGCIQYLAQDPANGHEIGWRLRPDRWGRGYALEAAERMARFAFDDRDAPRLCAICDPANTRSAHLMEKLGMRFRGRETWHARQVLVYQIERAQWRVRDGQSRAR